MKIKMKCDRCKTSVYEYETAYDPDYDHIPDERPKCHEYFDFEKHLYTDGIEQGYGIVVEETGSSKEGSRENSKKEGRSGLEVFGES